MPTVQKSLTHIMSYLIYDLLERLDTLSNAYISYNVFSCEEVPKLSAINVADDLEIIINEFRDLLNKEKNEHN